MPDFFPVAVPPSTPTACVACLSAHDPGGFVDCERDLLGYGTVYLCATCARQIGARFGMVTSEEVSALEDASNDVLVKLAETEAELAKSRDRVIVSRADLDAMFARPASGVGAVKTDRRRGPK